MTTTTTTILIIKWIFIAPIHHTSWEPWALCNLTPTTAALLHLPYPAAIVHGAMPPEVTLFSRVRLNVPCCFLYSPNSF